MGLWLVNLIKHHFNKKKEENNSHSQLYKGTDKLINDIEMMVGKKPKWFSMSLSIIWKYICPVFLLVKY
jgi:hypothetical protein